MSNDYNIIVIGAGSGGVRLSRVAASLGAKVAVIEEQYLGGTCVNIGCVPKKLFVYGSHFAEEIHDARGYGWALESSGFNWDVLKNNKDKEIKRLNDVYHNLLKQSGVDLIEGKATVTGLNTICVNEKKLSADKIVIATGGKPFIPPIPGKEHLKTSTDMFYLKHLPKSAVVWGGGYIAVEFAGILAGLGVDTTLIYRGDLFLRGFDEDIRHFIKEEMTKKGIRFLFNTNIESVEKISHGKYQLRLSDSSLVETGMVLAATGRVPNTQGIGLESIALGMTKSGEIIVDDNFKTNVDTVFAIGDVTGGMQLTPIALAEGQSLAHYLVNGRPVLMDYENIPTAVFCQPAIGTVGLTETQARAKFTDIDVYVSEFKPMKHTMTDNQERCLMKLIVDRATDKVVGAHMAGADAGEIIQGIAVAIKAGARKADFDGTIGIHPTAAEEFVTMRTARS